MPGLPAPPLRASRRMGVHGRACEHSETSDCGRCGSSATAPQPLAPMECIPSSSGFMSSSIQQRELSCPWLRHPREAVGSPSAFPEQDGKGLAPPGQAEPLPGNLPGHGQAMCAGSLSHLPRPGLPRPISMDPVRDGRWKVNTNKPILQGI